VETYVGPLAHLSAAPKLRSINKKKLQYNDFLNLSNWFERLQGSNPKIKYTTHKNYIKIKIIKMCKMERTDGPIL
jgi:hypothetical protein